MPHIDSVRQLAAIIRLQMEKPQSTLGWSTGSGLEHLKQATSPSLVTPSSSGKSPQAANGVAIAQWIQLKVSILKRDDPHRKSRAFRIFLEAVLAQEFGINLIGDIEFQKLVEQVFEQMMSDTELRTAAESAATTLLAEPET